MQFDNAAFLRLDATGSLGSSSSGASFATSTGDILEISSHGPGVLRIRITLVDLVSTKPEASVVILLTPYATIPDLMSGAATGKPVLAIMGAEEQIAKDPRAALAAYRAEGAQTKLIQGAGHSPEVEKPAQTAALILAFDKQKSPAKRPKTQTAVQSELQKSRGVRTQP